MLDAMSIRDDRKRPAARPIAKRSDPRRALGRLGEDFAVAHLERRGFAILDRNARTRDGEIDVVSFDGNVLAFVEVKSRRVRTSTARAGATTARSGESGPASEASSEASAAAPDFLASSPAPLEGLRHRQRTRLRRLATAWLQEHPDAPRAHELRFDAIGVLVGAQDRLLRLDHVEGAW
jgi:putative endonuclease